MLKHIKKTHEKQLLFELFVEKKKETHPKYTKDDNIVFHIKYLNVLYK